MFSKHCSLRYKAARGAGLLTALILGGSIASTSAHAVTILTFGQIGNGNTVTGTDSGGTSTTITSTNTAISITQIDNAVAVASPLTGYLDLNLISEGSAINLGGGAFMQHFSGTFSITSGTGDTGTNYLSGSLVDVALGQGVAFSLVASTPIASNVIFTSDVISDLALDRGASLSFANVTPSLSIDNLTLNSFSGSISGTFSADVPPTQTVPEPASLAVLGLGITGLGLLRRRSAR